MKIGICFKILVFFILCASCTTKDPYTNTEKIKSLCKKLVTSKSSHSIAVSMKVDTFINARNVFGPNLQEEKQVIDSRSEFRIASVTKPITATAILQLVESKQLSFDDNINRFFPDYPNGKKINVYHLLSHTSGIPNWWEGKLPENQVPENFPMCKHPHLYLQQMEIPLLFEPGSYHSYSNSGYVLLGEIIEKVSNLTFEEYLQKNIFSKAGMNHTRMEHIENPKDEMISGFVRINDSFTTPETYHMPFAAGGLRSTTEDLILFLDALEQGKLIGPELFDEMTSYAKLKNGNPVHTALYSPNGEPISFPNNIKKFGYGLGFQIIENFGKKIISHGGDIAGFNAVLMFVPHNKVKLAILSNTENGILSKLKSIEKNAIAIEY